MTTVYTLVELVGHSGMLVAHCRRNFTHSNETTRSSLRDGLAVDYLHSAVSRNYCYLSCRWRAPFRQTR